MVCGGAQLAYPELVGPGARARLVVLALEVGGRWSEGSQDLCAVVGKGSGQIRTTIHATSR